MFKVFFRHMTLHWSPEAPGAAMPADPWLFPLSPSRLRPWKAPKKDSSFTWAGFLAGVDWRRYKRECSRLRSYSDDLLICLWHGGGLPWGDSGGSWSELSWLSSLRFSWPGQLAGVSFNIRNVVKHKQCSVPAQIINRLRTSMNSFSQPEDGNLGFLLAYLSLFRSSW